VLVEPIEIIAGDLLIRPWQPEDADAVYEACQDPEIQRWTGVPSPYTRADARGFVGGHTEAAWSTGTSAPLGVFDLHTGRLLGAGGLASTNPVRNSAEVGYWTAPWARGRGVALTATRAVATWAFAHFGLARLTWSAEIGNHASRLVALRAGFQISGEQRLAQPRSLSERLAGGACQPHPGGRREAWVGSLLPGEVTGRTPQRYASGSLAARRAAVFGAAPPVLPLDGVPGSLRGWRPADVPAATRACQDPESARWTTVPTPYGTDDAEFYSADLVPGQWARGAGAGFAIADGDDRYAGSIDLRLDPSDEGSAEVGFLVAPWARGKGYASAAVRTVCGWGFSTLGLERIVWKAYLGNDGSRRVAEKAGFAVEGVGRGACVQRGERRDAWVGSLLATDRPPDAAAGG
jgi:RimJ/RimL family protein N-acetyltransferase